MTGVETGLLIALAGVLGLTGGKVWERRSIETKFLPRVEHDLGCDKVQLQTKASIKEMKDEIIKAIKDNGRCSHCEGNPSRSEE